MSDHATSSLIYGIDLGDDIEEIEKWWSDHVNQLNGFTLAYYGNWVYEDTEGLILGVTESYKSCYEGKQLVDLSDTYEIEWSILFNSNSLVQEAKNNFKPHAQLGWYLLASYG